MARKQLPDADYLRQRFRYDPVTGDFTWRQAKPCMFSPGRYSAADQCANWNTRHAGRKAGCVRGYAGLPYIILVLHHRQYKAHRVAWKIMTGEEPPPFIDHIDGDGTNNAWANLRVATPSQNCANSQKKTAGLSAFKGVSPNKLRWRARITIDGTIHHIGSFPTEEDAARAYDAAAIAVYGDFAKLNFPAIS